MDNIRVFLVAGLFMVSFMLWQAWQQDYGQQPVAESQYSDDSSVGESMPEIPEADEAGSDLNGDVPEVPSEDGVQTPVKDDQPEVSARSIHVVTDVLDLEIDLRGGSLVSAALLNYPITLDKPEQKLHLLNQARSSYFVFEGGLISRTHPAPNHQAVFSAGQDRYTLNGDEIRVPLTWQQDGISVTKTFVLRKGSYEIGIEYTVDNSTGSEYKVSNYEQMIRSGAAPESDTPFMQTYFGAALYERKEDGNFRYSEIEFEDLHDEPVKVRQQGGWAAMVQLYFLGAILPTPESTLVYTAAPQKTIGRYMMRGTAVPTTIPAQSSGTLNSRLYVGPKLQENLKDIAPGLELTVDYSWLGFISKPLFWLLNWLHGVFGNWGIAIILITVAVKLAFYKLSEAQYRSMAKMKVFAPRIKKLKERYGDDREKMQQAMMKLYKEEKFNPLGGCWPLLVQIPVFIALYWVLLESVELRQAPFYLWIEDLSVKDPYFVLPLLLGAAMFAQQRLSNQAMTMDPMQAKIMQFMPVMMTVFFAFFPAGLVLYWFFNTLLGMLQQWYITRKIDAQAR